MPEAAHRPVVPDGYSRVNPWVISIDTDAEIAFLRQVFGAKERPGRMNDADGKIGHAEVEVHGLS